MFLLSVLVGRWLASVLIRHHVGNTSHSTSLSPSNVVLDDGACESSFSARRGPLEDVDWNVPGPAEGHVRWVDVRRRETDDGRGKRSDVLTKDVGSTLVRDVLDEQ